MRICVALFCALATLLCLGAGFAQGQSESGFPLCKKDGSIPDGYNQCECPNAVTYRGEFNDPKLEIRVLLPDGIVGIGSCTSGGSFRIYLPRPSSSVPGGDFPWNTIWVAGAESTRVTFQKIIEGWKQSWNADIDEGRISDLQRGQPEGTLLGTLTALRLKARWTERDQGNLISEMIVANNPEKNITYQIGIISPANSWETNHKLFQTVVDGFRYVPTKQLEEH